MLPWLVLALASPVGPARHGVDLSMIASQSPRPALCRSPEFGGGPGDLWDRARAGDNAAFCLALAQGYARLANEPEKALESVQRAARLASASPSVLVLEGQAEFRLGRYDEAWASLKAAWSESRAAVASFSALHDLARLALGHRANDLALEAYRALSARVELSGDAGARASVYIEAAACALATGPALIDEALGYLAEAERGVSNVGYSDLITGLSALALDRQGRSERARAVLRRVRDGAALEQLGRRGLPEGLVLPPGELSAVLALLSERDDPQAAADYWDSYLADAGPHSVWADHARAARARLAGGQKGR